ncbi:CDP-glucose 4,6-dehydratase [Chitinispirillales bacterium ANBcel5]|uniref:CDP-glucose 4,6-dehydratase n=1 Tax=Cellulosispirillum alkaliphilum TaxID=3039283 RepID=UPI002A56EF9C|nr:CDP-glucose 4,6-dehydratase [Chitinispirillales bacterium ANBcel5]
MNGTDLEKMFGSVYKGKKVLVTGHSGFKGSWLSLWLCEMGAQVSGYSLTSPTTPNHYSLLDMEIDSTTADILDKEKLGRTISRIKPDIVFHLAAQPLVRLSYDEPVETFTTNVIGTLNVLDECRKSDSVQACVVVTSDKVYENREWVWGYRETDPFGGYDPYSASKGCTEVAVASYRRSFLNPDKYGQSHNLLVATARAGNVIGGGDWALDRLLPDVVRAVSKKEPVVIRNPGAIRPWQHVLECLSGYLLLGEKLLRGNAGYAQGWNFGPEDKDALTVEQVMLEVEKSWPAFKYTIDDQRDNHPHEAKYLKLDCSKAKNALGWKTVWDAEKAINTAIRWYKSFYEVGKADSVNDLYAYIQEAGNGGNAWAHF